VAINVHSTCLTEMCTVRVLPKCAHYVSYRNVHSTCLTEMCTVRVVRNVHSTCLTEMCTAHVLPKHSLPTTRSIHLMTLYEHTAASDAAAQKRAYCVRSFHSLNL